MKTKARWTGEKNVSLPAILYSYIFPRQLEILLSILLRVLEVEKNIYIKMWKQRMCPVIWKQTIHFKSQLHSNNSLWVHRPGIAGHITVSFKLNSYTFFLQKYFSLSIKPREKSWHCWSQHILYHWFLQTDFYPLFPPPHTHSHIAWRLHRELWNGLSGLVTAQHPK